MLDYSNFLLEARKYLKLYEEAVITHSYKEAQEHALNAFAEIKLLVHIAKDLQDGKKG
jgi:hypothetical protein